MIFTEGPRQTSAQEAFTMMREQGLGMPSLHLRYGIMPPFVCPDQPCADVCAASLRQMHSEYLIPSFKELLYDS